MKALEILTIISGFTFLLFVGTFVFSLTKKNKKIKLVALFLFFAFIGLTGWTGLKFVSKSYNKVVGTFGPRPEKKALPSITLPQNEYEQHREYVKKKYQNRLNAISAGLDNRNKFLGAGKHEERNKTDDTLVTTFDISLKKVNPYSHYTISVWASLTNPPTLYEEHVYDAVGGGKGEEVRYTAVKIVYRHRTLTRSLGDTICKGDYLIQEGDDFFGCCYTMDEELEYFLGWYNCVMPDEIESWECSYDGMKEPIQIYSDPGRNKLRKPQSWGLDE